MTMELPVNDTEKASPPEGPEGCILVVDDDRDVLLLIRTVLQNEGLQVCCADNGKKALKHLKERSFSVMLTDLNMPGMDGFELTVKALTAKPDLVVVMSTGGPNPAIHRQAKEIGILKVLAKPLDFRELLAILQEQGIAMNDRNSLAADTVAETPSEYSTWDCSGQDALGCTGAC